MFALMSQSPAVATENEWWFLLLVNTMVRATALAAEDTVGVSAMSVFQVLQATPIVLICAL